MSYQYSCLTHTGKLKYQSLTGKLVRTDYENSGNTNKCTILQSIYSSYFLIPICFSIITIFREVLLYTLMIFWCKFLEDGDYRKIAACFNDISV